MGEMTKIEWTDTTFNPWIGCTKVAAGCVKTSDAYWRQPLKWNRQAQAAGVRRRVFCASLADVFEDWRPTITHHGREGWRLLHCDGCGKYHPDSDNNAVASCACGRFLPRIDYATLDDLRASLFELIDATPYLDWLLLTKHPENARKMWRLARPHNVWLCVRQWPEVGVEA